MPTVPIAMFGWPLVVLVMFTVLPPRLAVLIGMIGAWLFLPIAVYPLPGLPDITKMSITCVSVFLGVFLVDAKRFSQVKWSWIDLAMLVWVLAPLPSAVSAGYGVYEGISAVLDQVVTWGMPYVIGRLYFSDAEGLRDLAIWIFVGGLLYAPLVLFEARMSPQLHTWIYGYHQHDFSQSRRDGGTWRPTVFMQHGLGVAMYMGTAAVCGLWMWTAGRFKTMFGAPVWMFALGLFVTAALCRSSYAFILMLTTTGVLFASRQLNTRLILAALLAITPAYVTARTVGGWDAGLLRTAARMISESRYWSLDTRLGSEEVLWQWVQGSLAFGRSRIGTLMLSQHAGKFIPDGLWLIALGKYGLVGLTAMFGVLLLPAGAYLARMRPRVMMGPEMAGPTVLMAVLVMYSMDNLLNALLNPIYLLAAGGLVVCRQPATSVSRAGVPATPAPIPFEAIPWHPSVR